MYQFAGDATTEKIIFPNNFTFQEWKLSSTNHCSYSVTSLDQKENKSHYAYSLKAHKTEIFISSFHNSYKQHNWYHGLQFQFIYILPTSKFFKSDPVPLWALHYELGYCVDS
jgi:hypothetical protein